MIVKQAVDVSFAQGLDTKTDPKRVQMGKFVQLENSVFQKGGLLQKRNGYPSLAALPNNSYSYLTTFNENLTALGPSIAAYSTATAGWVSKGSLQPLSLSTLPLIRNNLNQTQCDAVVAPNGLVLTTYLELNCSTVTAKYAIADSVTGQNIVPPTVIPDAGVAAATAGGVRVFFLGNNFIVMFTNAASHLQYIAINAFNTLLVTSPVDIDTAPYAPKPTISWDAYVVGTHLYIAYNTTAGGGQRVRVRYLTAGLALVAPADFAGQIATMMSVTADITGTTPVIYVNYYDLASKVAHSLAVDQNLNTLMTPTVIPTPPVVAPVGPVLNITSVAENIVILGVARSITQVFFEVQNVYGFDATIPTNYIQTNVVELPLTVGAGTVGTSVILIRSVGLASKAFLIDGNAYVLTAFQSKYQPSYFLVSGDSTEDSPIISAKLAYQNGGGYLTQGLPSVTVTGNKAQIAYRFKDLIQAVNKDTAVPPGTQVAGVYSQTGINLVSFVFGTELLDTAEIGNDLHITGGFLWMYDGYLPVEHNFFLWVDTDSANTQNIALWSDSGGSMAAQPGGVAGGNNNVYFYQFVYEWTDNNGNAFRSAPSIPVPVSSTSGSTSVVGSVRLNIPTLRLTYKTANPVKIVVYRWSVGQQIYYQTTSIVCPIPNFTAGVDYVTFFDTNSDAQILGNNIIYTNGGVVEDVNAPASNLLTLFDTRLWLVDAEDPNLVWFSKQVIEATPVEMSDLLTMFIPPNTGTNISTGPITSIATMDDKVLFGKKNAWVYVNGAGPDNTGANNQYSQPIFITSTVGCANQKSIVLTPGGLMFESDKGIWILNRGLGTDYIGAPVEKFTTGAHVNSAVLVPETNQVRFTLDTGITLMYDYYYEQWGVFRGVPAVSSCIFQSMHTFINKFGATHQELPGTYIDGSNPVLMEFTTGPLRLGDLQNYQRAYFFYILGQYLSPHKLYVTLTYDYADTPSQSIIISPTNFSPTYGTGGSESPYGQGTPYGGGTGNDSVAGTNLELWRVFLKNQRCMAFSIGIQEVYDPTLGVPPGAGLTLSGLNVVVGLKQKFRPQPAASSVG